VGKTLGIRDCHGGMRPEAKAAFVASVKSRGYSMAMVGDGVNDVPALDLPIWELPYTAAARSAGRSPPLSSWEMNPARSWIFMNWPDV